MGYLLQLSQEQFRFVSIAFDILFFGVVSCIIFIKIRENKKIESRFNQLETTINKFMEYLKKLDKENFHLKKKDKTDIL